MIKITKPLSIVLAIAALSLMAPRLSRAETNQYCYDHPSDHSDYCYCYRHPKQCNSQWRSNHPDWNRRPDEAAYDHHHHHNQAYYNNQGHPPNHEGEYHIAPPNGQHHQGPPPNQSGHPNDYNAQQDH